MATNDSRLEKLLSSEWAAFDVRRDLDILEKIPRNSVMMVLHGSRPDETSIEYVFRNAEGLFSPYVSVAEMFPHEIIRAFGGWRVGDVSNEVNAPNWKAVSTGAGSLHELFANVVAICLPKLPSADFIGEAYRGSRDVRIVHDGDVIWEGQLSVTDYNDLIRLQASFRVARDGSLGNR